VISFSYKYIVLKIFILKLLNYIKKNKALIIIDIILNNNFVF